MKAAAKRNAHPEVLTAYQRLNVIAVARISLDSLSLASEIRADVSATVHSNSIEQQLIEMIASINMHFISFFGILDNIVRELETFLSDIKVIQGSLSIIRSYPLLSLGFFKSLEVIEGDKTGKEKYGLKVLENQNLQELFTQNVTVKRGRMFFHFNPKLCMSTIEHFKVC